MLKRHEELLAALKKAEDIAVSIEKAGGNVQATIHHVRGAIVQTGTRVGNYREQAKSDAEAAAAQKAADEKAQAEAEALAAEEKAKAAANAKK